MLEKFRYLTSGESHGQALTCIIDGVPANLLLSADYIDQDLARRQKGFGRGGRMKIESDRAKILAGVRQGKTLGSPITLLIENKDWANWQDVMSPASSSCKLQVASSRSQVPDPRLVPVTHPRPGHADLSGALKYNTHDIRNILERSSARETAARVAAGAVAKKFLAEFNVKVLSYVTAIGGIKNQGARGKGQGAYRDTPVQNQEYFLSLFKKAEASPVRCHDKEIEKKIVNKINAAMKKDDTLGGVFEVVALGVPAGLGSYTQWDRKLDAKLAFSFMSIQAIKGVEIGLGFEMAQRFGSEVMDEIFYQGARFYRRTNNAGGIEGGMSNGMPLIVRAAMKPIPTLRRPLSSVDIISKKPFKAAYERSDVCAVPAASVIGEAVMAVAIADSFLSKFGGDSIEEIKRNYKGYLKQINEF